MKQPVKNKGNKTVVKKEKTVNKKVNKTSFSTKKKKEHPQYGTSKLEEKFATEFLDKLGLDYIYQFEAKDIGRFYDFYCQGALIEIDGDYYHSNPLIYEEKDLNKMQMKNKKVDEYKTKWALMNGFPIYRFWEKDINENPTMVLNKLKEIFYLKDGEQKNIHKKDINVQPRKKNIKKK